MSQPFESSVVKFNVLVVDDDSTSLSIVSALLKSWQYDVITVKSALDALATIRIKNIDLVVTDLHMPKMNGLQLQKQIDEEFKLPVVIMSSDDRESTILKSLASGVVFYIVKPINPDDLKNVWQYAVASRKGKSIYIEEIGSIQVAGSCDDIVSAASSVKQGKHSKKDSKRKYTKRGKEDHQEGENTVAPKKSKVAWTDSLHNRFLQAIKHISLEKAVPKKILEYMNVPGLTRENVASHLQKYRLFLKRVAEKGYGTLSKNSERAPRSSFASGDSSLPLKNALEYAQITGNKHQMGPLFQPEYGGRIMGFPSFGASSSNSVSQGGLLGNQANFYQSLFGSTNPLYQANGGTTFGTGSDDNATNLLSSLAGASSLKNFDTSGWKPSTTSGYGNMGTINYSNYAGIRINDDGELLGTGQTKLNGNGLNGTGNDDMTGLVGNATLPYLAQGESSNSAGLQNTNYQFPPAFSGSNEQENALVMPPLSQQKYGLGNNGQTGFSFAGITTNPDQFDKGTDIGDLLFEPIGYQFRFQQQGGENVLNPNFPGGSYRPGVTVPINQSKNPDLSSSFCFEENSPWNIEPTLEQLQEIEEFASQDIGCNASLDEYYPSLNQNPNQQQGNEAHINNELIINSMDPPDNVPSDNQVWDDDEFINSFFE